MSLKKSASLPNIFPNNNELPSSISCRRKSLELVVVTRLSVLVSSPIPSPQSQDSLDSPRSRASLEFSPPPPPPPPPPPLPSPARRGIWAEVQIPIASSPEILIVAPLPKAAVAALFGSILDQASSSNAENVVCKVCFENIEGGFVRCNTREHTFCQECAKGHINYNISVLKMPRCMDPSCSSSFSEYLQNVYYNDSKYMELTRVEANRTKSRWCSRPSCNTPLPSQPDPDSVKVMCLNPVCQTWNCWNCRVIWHEGVTCKEFQSQQKDKTMDKFLRRQNIKNCPNCTSYVQKASGCDYVVCWNCQYNFCWSCLDPHFHDSHVHGPNYQYDYIPPKSWAWKITKIVACVILCIVLAGPCLALGIVFSPCICAYFIITEYKKKTET